MSEFNLSGSFIQDTFQRLVQVGSGSLMDGTGSALPISISGSNVSLTGSLDVKQNITASNITASNITASNINTGNLTSSNASITNISATNITATGTVSASSITTPLLKVSGSSEFSGSLQFNAISFTETAVGTHGGSHIWGSNTQSSHYYTGSITASNNIHATNFYGNASGLSNVTASAITGTPSISVTNISASDINASNITASNVSASGAISSSTLTSQGQASVGSLIVGSSSIDPSGAVKNMVLKFNGTHFVPQIFDYDFQFSISTFTYATTTQLIGAGTWKNPGEFEFEATYQNPAISSATIEEYDEGLGTISTFTSNFTSPSNSVAINYPSTVEGLRFKISASGETKNGSIINFVNSRYHGASTQASSFDANFITGSLTAVTTNNTINTDIEINSANGKFIFYAQRKNNTDPDYSTQEILLGTSETNAVVAPFTRVLSDTSVTNTLGFSEEYELYKSDITMSDSTVYLNTRQTIQNYTYYGAVASWDNSTITETDVEALPQTAISSTVPSSLSVSGVSNKHIILAYPSRSGAKNFPITAPQEFAAGALSMEDPPRTISITNKFGYTENYLVYKSSQALDTSPDNLVFSIQ